MLGPATPRRRTLRSARTSQQRSVSVIEASAANAVSKMPTDSPCSLAQRDCRPSECQRLPRLLSHDVLPAIRRDGYWAPRGTDAPHLSGRGIPGGPPCARSEATGLGELVPPLQCQGGPPGLLAVAAGAVEVVAPGVHPQLPRLQGGVAVAGLEHLARPRRLGRPRSVRGAGRAACTPPPPGSRPGRCGRPSPAPARGSRRTPTAATRASGRAAAPGSPAPPPRRRRGAPRPPRCARWAGRTGRRRSACAWRRRRSGRWTRRRAAGPSPSRRDRPGPGVRRAPPGRARGPGGRPPVRRGAGPLDVRRLAPPPPPAIGIPRPGAATAPRNGGHSGDATGGAQRATRRCDRDVIVRGCRAARATPRPTTGSGSGGSASWIGSGRVGSGVAGGGGFGADGGV